MTISSLSSEERAEMEYLCAWIATQKSDVFKNPFTILAVALRTPQDNQLRDTLTDCQDFLSAIEQATEGAGQIDGNSILRPGERMRTTAKKLAAKAKKVLDAESCRRNAEVKPAYPHGRFASRLEGGV